MADTPAAPKAAKAQKEGPPQDVFEAGMGDLGRYQIWIFLLILLCKLPAGWHIINIIILGPKPKSVTCSNSNDTCPALEKCGTRTIDPSPFTETIISEWDLVCERKLLAALAQMLIMFGVLVGSIVFGMWGDINGRKLPLCIAVTAQAIIGTAMSYCPWLWPFLIGRFLISVCGGGAMTLSFVLLMELIGRKWRMPIGTLFQIPAWTAHMSLAGFGYAFRDWRFSHLMQSVPGFILIGYFFLLPESPRYLVAAGKVDRAIKVVTQIAKINKRPTDKIDADIRRFADELAKANPHKGGFGDLFRPKRIFLRTVITCFNWIVIGGCFYGVAQYASYLGGDIFLNITMSAAMEIPGTLLATTLITRLGSKWTTISMAIFAGTPMMVVPFLDMTSILVPSMALIAMFGLAGLFSTIYVYTGQMYPTFVRSAAIGFGSMTCRIGSIVAPLITGLTETPWGAVMVPMIYGVSPILAAIATLFFLPDTRGAKLPESIEDAIALGKKQPKE